jgi:hypothetical protein
VKKILLCLIFIGSFSVFAEDMHDHRAADSTGISSPDSLIAAYNESAKKDSLAEPKLTKRKYNHKEQVYFAVGMMAFFALILTTAQSWNPD